MLSNKKELIEFFKYLINILEENKLWYRLEAGTLLGAIREGKMIDWDDDIDLLIDINTLNFLKKNYKQHFLDQDIEGYPFIFPKFVLDINNYKNSAIAIDLFVFVNSTKKRMKQYSSLKNKINYGVQSLWKKSHFKPFDFPLKILKIVLWFLIPFFKKPILFEQCYNIAHEKENPEIAFMIENPAQDLARTFSPFTEDLEPIRWKFENIYVNVPKNYDEILKIKYGPSYMIPDKSINNFEHLDAVNVKKN